MNADTTENQSFPLTSICRRDIVLMSVGLAVLCFGKFADSAINGYGAADSIALTEAVTRVAGIPATIGNWTSTDSEISDREKEVAGIDGYIRRTYTNQRTGYEVHLTILCGPAGPIAVHPPTACFEGIGYTLASGPVPATLKSADQSTTWQFNRSSFRQGDASVPEIVRVFWGWSTDGVWQSPANPRIAFRGQPFLYKIYVTDSWIEDTGDTALPQAEAFLRDALPVIQAAVTE